VIKFECETCFQDYKVRDDRAGQVLKCKSCGSKMRVPAGDDDLLDDTFEESEAPVRPTRKKKKAGSAKKKKKQDNSNNPITMIAGVCAFGIAFYVSYTLVGGLFGEKKQNEVDINQEMKQIATDLKEKSEAIQKAVTKEEKQKIAQSMKTNLDRAKVLSEKQKAINAKKSATNGSSSQKWISLVDAPSVVTKWPESSKLKIDLKNVRKDFIQPNTFSPFVGLRYTNPRPFKVDFWNLATGKIIGQVSINIDKNWILLSHKIKMSSDGKSFILSIVTRDTKIPKLTSWSITTGEKIAEWEADKTMSSVSIYEICGSDKAFAKIIRKEGNQYKTILKLWDLTSGKLLKENEVKSSEFFDSNYAISPGGKYLISSTVDKLFVYDLTSLKMIRLLDIKDYLDPTEKYPILSSMQFSVDGKQLGLLVNMSMVTSVWLIDLETGKSTKAYQAAGSLDKVFSEPAYEGNKLILTPSGNSFLLYGALLVDRQSKRNVWLYHPVPNVIMRNKLYITPHYILAGTDSALTDARGRLRLKTKPKLVSVPLPEKKIADSLAAYQSEGEAILSAGKQVSIDVKIAKVKFSNEEEVKSILRDVIRQRLESEGFKVVPNQPIVFKLEYGEQEGNKLQMTKRGKPTPGNPLGRTATGQSLQTTAAAFKLSWIEKKTKRTLWTKQALVNPRFLILRDATAEEARKQMFEGLQNRLMAESIPYFIPHDKNLSMLPGETQLPE